MEFVTITSVKALRTGQRIFWFALGGLAVALAVFVRDQLRTLPRLRLVTNAPPVEAIPAARLKSFFRTSLAPEEIPEVNWPGGLGEMQLDLKDFTAESLKAESLKLRLVPLSAADSRKGKFSRILVECRRLDYDGLVFHNLALDCRDARIHLPLLLKERRLEFLHLGELRPSVELGPETVKAYVARQVPWLRDLEVSLQDAVRVRGKAFGLPVDMAARLWLSPDRLTAGYELQSVRAGGIPLPLLAAGLEAKKSFSLAASAERPFFVALDGFTLQDNVLRIEGRKD